MDIFMSNSHGKTLREIRGSMSYDYGETIDGLVTGLKKKVDDEFEKMQESAKLGDDKYTLFIHLAYTKRNLDEMRDAVAELNKTGYQDLKFEVVADKTVYIVSVLWN